MIAPSKQRLLNILLADDGSKNMLPAIQLLVDLPHDPNCVITALRVFTPQEGSEFASARAGADETKNLLDSRHFHFQSKQAEGHPSDTILHYAGENSPDLIVMGSKASGRMAGFLGNVATNVIHTGRWPVLIVRGAYNGLKRVLLVTDGSFASQFTCEYFGSFPIPDGTNLEVMHVVVPVRATYPVEPAGLALPIITPDEENRINQENLQRGQVYLERAQKELGWPKPVKLTLKIGDPIEKILAYIKSENIDLLVCGSRGGGNFTGWLMGSISRELVQHAPCSVLVIRTPHESARQ